VCATCLLALTGRAAAEELPRYRLKVGQELTYHHSGEFNYKVGERSGVHRNDDTWDVRVLRQNADGSWRLLLHLTTTFWVDKQKKPEPQHYLGCCDLFADGRLGPDANLGYRINPTNLFPRLPADAAALAKGWDGLFERDASRTRYTLDAKESVAGKSCVFTGVQETPLDKIYLSTNRTTFTFDPARGLVVKGVSNYTQGYGFDGKGTATMELVGVKDPGAGDVAKLAAEADRYFAAAKKHEELTLRASQRADAKDLLTQAEAALKDARAALSTPLLQEQLDAELKQHARMANHYSNTGPMLAGLLNKPAADWATKDLDGKPVALKDLRGKVVVLDWWYRGCGWCIRAMPQVAQVADDFRNEPVVVLGMNTDPKEEDAKFVVEKMGIRYPVLKAEGLPQKYHVSAFPTLIIIDAKGDIRDLHVGYSATLREDVSATIRKLLAEVKTASK
jgi:peroxiredoxin